LDMLRISKAFRIFICVSVLCFFVGLLGDRARPAEAYDLWTPAGGPHLDIGFRVDSTSPNASSLDWIMPYAIQPWNALDATTGYTAPYRFHLDPSSNNIIRFAPLGIDRVAEASGGCPTSNSNCFLTLSTTRRFGDTTSGSCWINCSASDDTTVYDFQATIAHELGHWAGANDNNGPGSPGFAPGTWWKWSGLGPHVSTMDFKGFNSDGWKQRFPTGDDAQAVLRAHLDPARGMAVDHSFEGDNTYPHAWDLTGVGSASMTKTCSGGWVGSCLAMFTGSGWTGLIQIFFNYGAGAADHPTACMSFRNQSGANEASLVIWNITDGTYSWSGPFVPTSTWQRPCVEYRNAYGTPPYHNTNAVLNNKWVWVYAYNYTPNATLGVDHLVFA
jgi:hypothetical protein